MKCSMSGSQTTVSPRANSSAAVSSSMGLRKRTPSTSAQIFSEKVIGPIFFEFIQRKEDEGFVKGNFEALFKSIERDQLKRGVISGGAQ